MRECEPWWATSIRSWIAMAQAILGASGKVADGWRSVFERKLEREPPGFLYKFYEEWANAMEREARS